MAARQPSPAVVVVAGPAPGATDDELEPLLGPERSARLRELLLGRALAWALEVAGGRVEVALASPRSPGVSPRPSGVRRRGVERTEPSGSGLGGHLERFEPSGSGFAGRLEHLELVGSGFGDRLAQVCDCMLAGGPRPLLIAWPQLARWRPSHASAALEDLAEGCGIVLGPLFDGGAYLIGLDQPQPTLLSLTDEQWQRPDAWSAVIGAADQAQVLLGLLRAERGLRREQDVRAALADPLTDRELRELLAER